MSEQNYKLSNRDVVHLRIDAVFSIAFVIICTLLVLTDLEHSAPPFVWGVFFLTAACYFTASSWIYYKRSDDYEAQSYEDKASFRRQLWRCIKHPYDSPTNPHWRTPVLVPAFLIIAFHYFKYGSY